MQESTPSVIIGCVTLSLLIGAMVIDVRSRRIPNWLTLPALGAGLAVRSIWGGPQELLMGVAGVFAAPACLLFLRGFRPLGMGDMKLAAAIGALLGPKVGALAMVISGVAGGLLAIGYLFRTKSTALSLFSPFFIGVPFLKRPFTNAEASEEPEEPVAIPYGVAIGAGTLLTAAFVWVR
jgi:prepilin peptidase CpaA